MNIPFCVLRDQTSISPKCYEYHQSLAKKLNNAIKRMKPFFLNKNYSKKKIYSWLFNLDINERVKVCTIYNDWFTKILFQLLTYNIYDNSIRFSPKTKYENFYKAIHPDFNDNYIYYGNESQNIFSTFFEGKTVKYQAYTNNSIKEKEFLKEIKFITINEFNDTITLSFELLKQKKNLQHYFDTFSNNEMFSKNIIPIKENKNNNIFNFSMPEWVGVKENKKKNEGINIINYDEKNEEKCFTISQLLTICFEQIISINYQIYLSEGEIPNFKLNEKIDDLLNTNIKLENFLAVGGEDNKSILSLFEIENIIEDFNSKNYRDTINLYENITEKIFLIVFGRKFSSYFIDEEVKNKEINNAISNLKKEYNKNISNFVNIISFIDSSIAFKKENIIYNIIYQKICKLHLQKNIDDLKNDFGNESKNKKKKRKNKKNENKKNEINNVIDKKENEKQENNLNIQKESEKNNIKDDNDSEYNNIENNLNSINSVENSNNIKNSDDEEDDLNDKEHIFSYDCFKYDIKSKKNEKEFLIEMKDLNESGKEIKNEIKNEIKEEPKNEIKKEEEINESDLLKELMEMGHKKKKKKKRKNKKKKENSEEEKKESDIADNMGSDKKIENIKVMEDKKIEENNIIQNNDKNKNEDEKKDKINIKEETKNNKKKQKEFFLFPIEHNKKKKGKKNEINKDNFNNSNLNNESNKIKDKEEDKLKISFSNTTISENEYDKNIENNNKDNILIQSKDDKIEFSEKQSNDKKREEKDENIQNENSINIIENSSNKKDFENKFDKAKIVNSNNPIINNYIFFDKNSFQNTSNFIDSNNINMNNNIIIQPQNSVFPQNYFSPPIMAPFNYPMPYQQLPNYYINDQNDLFNDLSNEILSYEKSVQNNLEKLKIYREKILNKIENYIEIILSENNYDFELINYGSYETKLSIEVSDIDILIKFFKKDNINCININNINNQQHIEEILSLLYNKLNIDKDNFNILLINAIYTASVPVLKIKCNLEKIIPDEIKNELKNKYLFNFEEEILQLNFDFTFIEVNNIKDNKKIPSLEIISYIKNVLNDYKEIKPILLFLKRYMKINKLNSSFHGGLSSYSTFLLLYAYIKSGILSGNTLGHYLYGFLEFYSNFNFGIYSINLNLSNPFNVLTELHDFGIMLIDPITNLNVAKSTFKVDQIKSVFTKGVVIIRNIIIQKIDENINKYNSKSIQNKKFLEELFKDKNRTKIFESMNLSTLQDLDSIFKWK